MFARLCWLISPVLAPACVGSSLTPVLAHLPCQPDAVCAQTNLPPIRVRAVQIVKSGPAFPLSLGRPAYQQERRTHTARTWMKLEMARSAAICTSRVAWDRHAVSTCTNAGSCGLSASET